MFTFSDVVFFFVLPSSPSRLASDQPDQKGLGVRVVNTEKNRHRYAASFRFNKFLTYFVRIIGVELKAQPLLNNNNRSPYTMMVNWRISLSLITVDLHITHSAIDETV